MALKNNNGFDKGTFIMYSLLPAIVLAIGLALFFYFNSQKADSTAATAAPVANQAQGAEALGDPSVDYSTPVAAPTAPNSLDGIVGLAVGDYKGDAPEILNILDKMGGFKEDSSASVANTVYIIYDPRCPFCHSLHDKLKTVDLKAKNIAVKWLPTVALGADTDGVKRASFGLHAKSVEEFENSLNQDVPVTHEVSNTDALRLEENLAFLFEASNQTFGEEHPKSVPATFFLDKKTGEPQMMYGASSDDVFRAIFGD